MRSCLHPYGPEPYISVKHYWSVGYMNLMLHSDQCGAERNNVDLQHPDRGRPRNQDHVDTPDQDHRGERDEDTGST